MNLSFLFQGILSWILFYSCINCIYCYDTVKVSDYPENFKILAVAGDINKAGRLTSDVELIDPFVENSHCIKPSNYPFKTSDITGSGGIVCGGSFENPDHSCFKYSIQDKTWSNVGSLNAQRYAASSVLMHDDYWITGGGQLNGLTSLVTSEILKDSQGPFTKSADLPEQLQDHCMSVLNDTHVFIAGGHWSPKSAYFVDVSVDPFRFTKLPPMLDNRRGAACGTIVWGYSATTKTNDFTVIVAGGMDYDTEDSSKTSNFYSPLANVWVNGPMLPRGFINGGYFTTKYYSLIMVGGEDENGIKRRDVMAFGNVMDSINFLPGKLETSRWAFAAVQIKSNEEC